MARHRLFVPKVPLNTNSFFCLTGLLSGDHFSLRRVRPPPTSPPPADPDRSSKVGLVAYLWILLMARFIYKPDALPVTQLTVSKQ